MRRAGEVLSQAVKSEAGGRVAEKLATEAEKRTATTLVGKLAEVMAAVKRIPKRGKNQSQGYAYATEADIADVVREELASRGIVMIPHVKTLSWRTIDGRSGPINVATVLMQFTMTDGGPERITFDILGEGMDSGDKNVYKAQTGAEKYALLKLFLIPTGDDPEADSKDEPKADERPSGRRQRAPEPDTKPAETKATTITEQMRRDLWDAIRVQWPDAPDKQKAIIVELCKAHGVEKSQELPLAQQPGNPEGYWHLLAWLDARKEQEKKTAREAPKE